MAAISAAAVASRRLRAPVRSSRSMPAAIKRQASACGPSTSSAASPNLTAIDKRCRTAAVSAGGRRADPMRGPPLLQQPPRRRPSLGRQGGVTKATQTELQITDTLAIRLDTAESRADTAAITAQRRAAQLQSRSDSSSTSCTAAITLHCDTAQSTTHSCNHGLTLKPLSQGSRLVQKGRCGPGSSSKPPAWLQPEDEPLVAHSALEIRASLPGLLCPLCPCGRHFEIRAVHRGCQPGLSTSSYRLGWPGRAELHFDALAISSGNECLAGTSLGDLPCTGVFAVISLLGSSFVTERSRSVRSELPVVAPLISWPRLLDRGLIRLSTAVGSMAGRRLHSEPPTHASFKCSRLQRGPVLREAWAGEAEQMMRQAMRLPEQGRAMHRSALGCGPVLMKRKAAHSNFCEFEFEPGRAREFYPWLPPACLPLTGQPAAFVFRPAATLAQIQGAFELLRISADSPPPKPFQSVATETVSDTVSPMFGVCLISGYRLRSGRRFKSKCSLKSNLPAPEAASSPPEFEADLESPVSAPQELSWPTATSCSSADGEATCSSKLGWDFPHSSLLFPFPHLAQPRASISVKVEEYEGKRRPCSLALRGRGLDKKDLFGKSTLRTAAARDEFIGEFSTQLRRSAGGAEARGWQFDILVNPKKARKKKEL
uniref:Protein kinase domain-containing protein n=1 Tax=Macrostomum lignano TaxID=282301 RepID=A0A1I8F6F2_9PLAT